MGKGGKYCTRGCTYCLASKTLHIAPTKEGYEAIYLNYQPRSGRSRPIRNSWKNNKVRRQWARHFKKHQDLMVADSNEDTIDREISYGADDNIEVIIRGNEV